MKMYKAVAVGLLFLSALLLISGCTITILHKFTQPPVQYIVVQNADGSFDPSQLPAGILPDNTQYEGTITLAVGTGVDEEIIVNRLVEGRRDPQFVGRIFPGMDTPGLEVPANVGSRFQFTIDGVGDYKIPTYSVTQLGETHFIDLSIRFKDSRKSYKRIPNAQASRSSYDILYIDATNIDNPKADGGGLMGQIFEDLDDSDTDWRPYDGDYALKNQFKLAVIDEGRGTQQTESKYGLQSFQESFSFNIGSSIGVPGVGSLSRSLGFDKSSTTTSASETIFTYSRKDQKVYTIELNQPRAKLTEAFKAAVLALPVPVTLASGPEAVKNIPEYGAYQAFIGKWGTHFPVKTTYGGFIVAYKTYSMEQLIEEEGFGIKAEQEVTADIKGVEVGSSQSGTYAQNERFENKESTSKSGFIYKGGQGDDGAWNVGDAVQPTFMEVERLFMLLEPALFSDDISADNLKRIQKTLSMVTTAYIGSSTDNGQSLKPKNFKMDNVNIHVKEYGDDGTDGSKGVFGVLQIDLIQLEPFKLIQRRVIFNRTDEAGKRINMPKGYNQGWGGALTFRLKHDAGTFNPENYAFCIYAQLSEHDDLSGNDFVGLGQVERTLNEVTPNPSTLMLSFVAGKSYDMKKLNDIRGSKINLPLLMIGSSKVADGWNMEITARLRELQFEDFFN